MQVGTGVGWGGRKAHGVIVCKNLAVLLQGLTFNNRTDVSNVLIADSRELLHHLDLPGKLL